MRRPSLILCLGWLLAGATGCVLHTPPPSPGFTAPTGVVESAWRRMEATPSPPARPVVLVAGWRGTGTNIASMRAHLLQLTGGDPDQFITVANPLHATVGARAAAIVDAVERRWPSPDPEWTTEVDVIGYSIGGVAARLAASPCDEDARRLRIGTLYTLASPHTGTTGWGAVLRIDPAAWQVADGSALLDRLNAGIDDASYTLVCYATLGDAIVGAKNAAPPGIDPIWTPATGRMSHFSIVRNRRILADIALRLRNEPPLQELGAPLPRDEAPARAGM